MPRLSIGSLTRLSFAWLSLPVALFAIWWTIPVVAIATVGALVATLVWGSRTRETDDRDDGVDFALLGAAFAVGSVWLLFSGVGGFGFQNGDYIKHNAMLSDLIARPWPVWYSASETAAFTPNDSPLVYYMAYYLVPALLGKWGGWALANIGMYCWTLLGLGLALTWLCAIVERLMNDRLGFPGGMVVCVIFALASGWDVVGTRWVSGQWPRAGDHIEWWGWFAQYSSNTTLLLWVPHQCVATWIAAGIIVESWLARRAPRCAGAVVTILLFWSPFGAIGLLPLAIGWCLSDSRRALTWVNGLVAPALALLIGLFLTANRLSFPMGWVWVTRGGFTVPLWIGFSVLEFGLVVGLIALLSRHRSGADKCLSGRGWQLIGLLSVMLVALPLIQAGARNDFPMRVSVGPLFAMWAVVIGMMISLRWRSDWKWGMLGAVVMALGVVTPICELSRNRYWFQWNPGLEKSDGAAMTRLEPVSDRVQYFGDPDAPFFRYVGRVAR